MTNDEIQKMEDRQVPHGRIDLIGCGRLGLRIGINLMQIHRGGPKTIGAFDGQKIDGGDVIFTLLGAEAGANKPDFIRQLCTHKKEFREVISYPEYVTEENLENNMILIVCGIEKDNIPEDWLKAHHYSVLSPIYDTDGLVIVPIKR
jgi:predicted ThiF/HesA family dinucleotide-utilizing enzyme